MLATLEKCTYTSVFFIGKKLPKFTLDLDASLSLDVKMGSKHELFVKNHCE